MKLEITRLRSTERGTVGALYDCTNGRKFLCFTLEDQFRFAHEKFAGETRIPAGTYRLKLRKLGGFHTRYAERFSAFHEGMIEVCDVPNFKWILFHCGNTIDDTAGCVLVGDGISGTGKGVSPRLTQSVLAYKRIYPAIVTQLMADPNTECVCRFTDIDWPEDVK